MAVSAKRRLQKLCRSFTGATEEILWDNDLVFKVGGKMFFCADESDHPQGSYSFKVADERFLELTDLPGIRPAPYLARAKWVQVDPSACELSTPELEALVEESYRLVFGKLTKKLQRSIQGTD